MCLYVHVHTCAFVCVCLYRCVRTGVFVQVRSYGRVRMCVFVRACSYVRVRTCVFICACLYVCACLFCYEYLPIIKGPRKENLLAFDPNEALAHKGIYYPFYNHSHTLQSYCYCNQSSYGFMIGCDRCGGWFHGDCVNITPHKARKLTTYFCYSCSLGMLCDSVSFVNYFSEEHKTPLAAATTIKLNASVQVPVFSFLFFSYDLLFIYYSVMVFSQPLKVLLLPYVVCCVLL